MGCVARLDMLAVRSLEAGHARTGFKTLYPRFRTPRLPIVPLMLLVATRPQAIEHNILEWVSLLHMRTPLCIVMLVASHYDVLHGTPEENEQLLGTVEQRYVRVSRRLCSSSNSPFGNGDADVAQVLLSSAWCGFARGYTDGMHCTISPANTMRTLPALPESTCIGTQNDDLLRKNAWFYPVRLSGMKRCLQTFFFGVDPFPSCSNRIETFCRGVFIFSPDSGS